MASYDGPMPVLDEKSLEKAAALERVLGDAKVEHADVIFTPADSSYDSPTVHVEVVSSQQDLRHGLMFRDDVEPGRGMLFKFPDRGPHSMWMKNTPLALDMIFMDKGGTVVDVIRDTEPFSEKILTPKDSNDWVLETPAGFTRNYEIKPGMKFQVHPWSEKKAFDFPLVPAMMTAAEGLPPGTIPKLVRRALSPSGMVDPIVGPMVESVKNLSHRLGITPALEALKGRVDKSIYKALMRRQDQKSMARFLKEQELEAKFFKHGADFYEKLKGWLLSDDPVKAIRDNWKEVAEAIPELAAEKGCKQDPSSHRYDVLGHSLFAVSLAPKEEVTRIAALFHDIGKPAVKRVDEKGINRFPDHGNAGAPIAARILKRLGAPKEVQELVPPLVGEHYISYKDGWSDKKVLQVVSKVDPLRLAQLAIADIEAHRKTCPHLEADLDQLDDLMKRIQRVTLEHGLHKAAAEFAPGIPEKGRFVDIPTVQVPQQWEFGVHQHKAQRAGEHLDLRLGNPETGDAFSWAMKRLPEPGKGTYAPMQPTHTVGYMDFKGEIPAGTYGAGTVELARRGKAEVVKATPDEVRFNVYEGKIPEQFVLKRRDGRMWTLNNITPARWVKKWEKLIPRDKPSLKEIKFEKLDPTKTDEVYQPKVDGAHGIAVIEGGKPTRLFSYREAKNPTGLIEHTHRMPGWWQNTAPEGMKPTVIRGEIYATDKKGKPIPAAQIGGLLNSGVLESRQQQEAKGIKMHFVAYDVERHEGKKVGLDPARVEEVLSSIAEQVPGIELMPTAKTPEEKARLVAAVGKGKHPLTREGIVARSVETGKAMKSKLKDDYDVFVRQVYAGTRPGEAGGFRFSHTQHGPMVGNVGGGFTRSQRQEMLLEPEKWIGRVAKVEAEQKFPSGALRAPIYKEPHLDKGLQQYHELA